MKVIGLDNGYESCLSDKESVNKRKKPHSTRAFGIPSALGKFVGKYTGVAVLSATDKIAAQYARLFLQIAFLIVTVSIGYNFGKFVASLADPSLPAYERPPGVEAFLPISSLISLRHLFETSEFTTIHPSGLVIFLIALATGLFLKRAFCSTMCPIGIFLEFLAFFNRLLFKKPVRLRAWIDFPLRSIKYLLLAFFAWAILVVMTPADISAFIDSPYNRVADIKMMLFFTNITPLALNVTIALIILSLLVPYFWCRYLCPYGALLGFSSLFSLTKIRRNKATCIDCKACTQVCPASITVHKLKTVTADECHACLKCVDACPVKNTLYVNAPFSRKPMSPIAIFVALAALFVLSVGVASLTGHWQNEISRAEYIMHYQNLDDPIYNHNKGQIVPKEH